jgi:non-canonical (house-cleaning) NTP pyrophosphatase
MTFIIRLCSESKIKFSAVNEAFINEGFKDFEVRGEESPSGVPDQPMGEETQKGAYNRAHFLKAKYPEDIIISIENGLFLRQDGDYDDRAVIIILTQDSRAYEGASVNV